MMFPARYTFKLKRVAEFPDKVPAPRRGFSSETYRKMRSSLSVGNCLDGLAVSLSFTATYFSLDQRQLHNGQLRRDLVGVGKN